MRASLSVNSNAVMVHLSQHRHERHFHVPVEFSQVSRHLVGEDLGQL
jgi:hypothetical protein